VSGNSRLNTTYSVGPSSGANYIASLEISGNTGTTVTVFPDDYYKYKSIYMEKSIID